MDAVLRMRCAPNRFCADDKQEISKFSAGRTVGDMQPGLSPTNAPLNRNRSMQLGMDIFPKDPYICCNRIPSRPSTVTTLIESWWGRPQKRPGITTFLPDGYFPSNLFLYHKCPLYALGDISSTSVNANSQGGVRKDVGVTFLAHPNMVVSSNTRPPLNRDERSGLAVDDIQDVVVVEVGARVGGRRDSVDEAARANPIHSIHSQKYAGYERPPSGKS
jgi:hypothetical protein